MSLRLATLDPNEPRANKDCRTCNRRRIKCDRTLPTCKKCSLRSLDCPGYGLRIRWDQGVASRGKLSGKSLPVADSPAVTPGIPIKAHTEAQPQPQPSNPHIFSPPQPQSQLLPAPGSSPPTWTPSTPSVTHSSSSSSKHPSPTLPTRVAISDLLSPPIEEASPPPPPDNSQYNTGFILQNPHALNIDFRARPLLPPLRDPSAQKLLNYYDHIVAATFPWIEGEVNHWRTVMVPLALECHTLLLAILALAAEHYESKTGNDWIFQDSRGSIRLRDECIRMLAHDLRQEMTEEHSPDGQGHASGILATILVLANLEMVRNSALWHVHWNAASTITRRWTAPPRSPTALDDNCRFLVWEAFTYDAFAATTTFDGNTLIPADVVHPEDNDIFTEYLRLIQDVTRCERSRHEQGVGILVAPFLRTKDSIREAFDAVRAHDPGFEVPEDREQDLSAVIDMFHFAGILYACQSMLDPQESEGTRRDCAETVLECRRQVQSVEGLQHDFVWPFFIVGTEARGFPEIQEYIEREVMDVMQSTGFTNCHAGLEFLRRFWRTTTEEWVNWIPFAREEARKGFRFLIT